MLSSWHTTPTRHKETPSIRIESTQLSINRHLELFSLVIRPDLVLSSAFDRINVRRLFITVEQALESAANDHLFELNDVGTRANFINIVEPFLTDIQSQRGIEDFRVICDDTNNTPDIVDNNEFRADIFIQPARSINFITLTFVATRGGTSFTEVTGS